MNLKTKISAAAEAHDDEFSKLDESGYYSLSAAFIAGSNFAIGEVQELLREAKRALEFYGHGWGEGMPNEIVGMKKDHFGSRARMLLKKIDDSGVLDKE